MRQTRDFTKITLATIAGIGLGAVAMYVLDPVSGKRRRELARDKAASAVDTLQSTARALQNRAKSVVGGATTPTEPERPGSGVV